MRSVSLRYRLLFVGALVLGVLLHFLYSWLPNPLTAVIAPVRESIWEHLKVLLIPMFLLGLLPTGKRGRIPWLCAMLTVCGLMLLIGWLYHIVFRGDALLFDLGLYAALMFLGFWLPRILWPLEEWPGVGAACAILTVLLVVLMVAFTFAPPGGILFADLSGGVGTFLTIPV